MSERNTERHEYMEPKITIKGRELNSAQVTALRVAVQSMLTSLDDPKHMENLGSIGPLYQARLSEVLELIGN